MINKIAIIGAGTMGRSIAHVYARHGYEVNLYDSFEAAIAQAPEKIRADLQFMVDEDYIPQEAVEETLKRINIIGAGINATAADILAGKGKAGPDAKDSDPDMELEEAVKDVDFVVEAIAEVLEPKIELFEKLDRFTKPECVLSSNTSSLTLSDIISRVSDERKKLCMVCHWINPAYLIPLVELSNFNDMPQEKFDEIMEFHRKCEKKPIQVMKDAKGMIANRILHAITRECMYIVDEGIGDADSVDDALTFGMCFRFATTGLREIIDMGGMDIWYKANSNTYPDLCKGDTVSPQIRDRALRGDLGLKTGKGFFDYSDGKGDEVVKSFYKRLLMQLKVSENY